MKYFFSLFLWLCSLEATPLHDAVKRGDINGLLQALEQGVSINALQDGTTALTWAVIHRQKSLIEALLDAGANLETGKMTPLYQALSSEDIDMAAFLVSQGAHINTKGPLTKRGMLYDLLLERKYQAVRFLLSKNATFDHKGHLRPFSLALTFAPLEVIKAFINRDASLNDEDAYLGTPLDIALRYKRHDVLKLIVDNGANVSAKNYLKTATLQGDLTAVKTLIIGQSGLALHDKTLLYQAIKAGFLDIAQELVKAGADINYEVQPRQTPLIIAMQQGHTSIVQWLLSQKLDPKTNQEALFLAIDLNKIDVVQALLDQHVGLDSKNSVGLTPLLWAMRNKQFAIARVLIERGCNIEARDKLGETALFKAVRLHQHALVQLLIDKGAQVNVKNSKGRTPLYVSVRMAYYEAFVTLLHANAQLESQSLEESALMVSVKRGLERFFYKLKAKSELIGHTTLQKETLLHIASAYNRVDIAKLLIFYHLALDARNERGETPLHVAAKNGHVEMVSLLLSFGADVAVLDTQGNSARQLAFKFNHHKLAKWFDNYVIEQEAKRQAKEHEEMIRKELQKEHNVTSAI